MKKLLLVLMIVTLMAGMSLPALAEEEPTFYYPFCPNGQSEFTFDVTMTILPWARVEYDGALDFEELGFCDITGYKLFWINSNAFLNEPGGAKSVYIPGTGQTWDTIGNKVHVNDDPNATKPEVNPQLNIRTNADLVITFAFGEDGKWLDDLPFYVPIWRMDQGYVGAIGQNVTGITVDGSQEVVFGSSQNIKFDGPGEVEYHLDGGILFSEDTFYRYEADSYYTTIVATVALDD